MRASIIIVNYNGLSFTRALLESIRKFAPGHDVVVVDNGSTDGSAEDLNNLAPDVTLVRLECNYGFSAANNRGAERATEAYLLFLNNDTLLDADTPSRLASFLEDHPSIGACGPRLLNEDGTLQISHGFHPSLINEWRTMQLQRRGVEAGAMDAGDVPAHPDWLTGAALMVRRDVFKTVHGFDEDFFMYFEDADLCRRIRDAGYGIAYLPEESLTHLKGRTVNRIRAEIAVTYRKSQLHYYKKHNGFASRLLLRIYLVAKYCIRLILLPGNSRWGSEVLPILRLVVRGRTNHPG